MAQTVVGLFESSSDAQKAIERLTEAGISRSNVDISVNNQNVSNTTYQPEEKENGITRFFKGLFGDNDDADRYSSIGNRGYSIVTVHAQSQEEAETAADVLDDSGAVDVDEKTSEYSTERQNISGTVYNETSDRVDTFEDSETVIPRIKEELQVGKREVESGGVRVRSRIVEKPVEESLRLREEHVRVDRQEVNRPVTDSDRSVFEDRDIELTERAEVPVVNKEARVVEEITISKDVDEHTETIRDTVRNTEVDIDNIKGDSSSRYNENRGSL